MANSNRYFTSSYVAVGPPFTSLSLYFRQPQLHQTTIKTGASHAKQSSGLGLVSFRPSQRADNQLVFDAGQILFEHDRLFGPGWPCAGLASQNQPLGQILRSDQWTLGPLVRFDDDSL